VSNLGTSGTSLQDILFANYRHHQQERRETREKRDRDGEMSLSEAVYKHQEEFRNHYKRMPRYILSWLLDEELEMSFEQFKDVVDSGKADPFTRAPHGGTCVHPLAMGAGRSREDCHKALMYIIEKHPVLANDRGSMTTETPIHLAAMYARKETFQGLLERGADPTAEIHMGETLIDTIEHSFLSDSDKAEMKELAQEAIENWLTKCHLPGCGATKSTEGRSLQRCGQCKRVRYCCTVFFRLIYSSAV